MVRGHRNVSGAGLDHAAHRSDHPPYRCDLAAVFDFGRQSVVVAEEFVCAVYEVDFQVGLQDNSTAAAGAASSTG